LGMLSSVYKWRLFFIASHPVFAVNNKQYNTIQSSLNQWNQRGLFHARDYLSQNSETD